MSDGIGEDLRNTLTGKTEGVDNKSWLRHNEGTQAYMVDYMLLEGRHTLDSIAQTLMKNNLHRGPLSRARERVKLHIRHLQNGHDQIPHRLRIKEQEDGTLRFV